MDENKELYILDFRGIKNDDEMHERIKRELDFPDYYGCNLDALWDCLRDMVGRPIHIQIVGFETVERLDAEDARIILRIFKKLKHHNNDRYVDQIKVEIIRANHIETVE